MEVRSIFDVVRLIPDLLGLPFIDALQVGDFTTVLATTKLVLGSGVSTWKRPGLLYPR